MTGQRNAYTVVPFPAERGPVVDAGRMASRRHIVHGLLEVDVSAARQLMREHKAQHGESLSFTAYIVTCLAHTIDTHKYAHAYRNWRNQLVVFDEVDAVTLIETQKGDVALPHIVRAANRKSLREIHDEIRSIQAMPVRSEQRGWLARLGPRAPAWARDVFYWVLRQNPHWFKKYAGTTVVTSVGMFGRGGGWGLGFLPMHTLGLTVGGIVERPGAVEGRIEIREYLCLTLSVDHDIVDGAPAARFARRLVELIEGGYGL